MIQSPLELKHYHFLTLELRAREDINPASIENSDAPYPSFEGIHLEPEVSMFTNEDAGEEGPYLLRLALAYTPEGNNFPYSFEVELEGVFAITDVSSVNDCKKTVVINGASVLYSAAREQLLTISGRHLFGPMLLPALNFQHLDV